MSYRGPDRDFATESQHTAYWKAAAERAEAKLAGAEKALVELQGWSPTGRTVLYSEVVAERDDLRVKLAEAEEQLSFVSGAGLYGELQRIRTERDAARARVAELQELHGNAVGNCERLGLALSSTESRLAAAEFERNNLAMRVEQLTEDTALSERFELIEQRDALRAKLAAETELTRLTQQTRDAALAQVKELEAIEKLQADLDPYVNKAMREWQARVAALEGALRKLLPFVTTAKPHSERTAAVAHARRVLEGNGDKDTARNRAAPDTLSGV